MKKLDLNKVADEFESISEDYRLFSKLDDIAIMPLSKSLAEGAAIILREAFPWCYGGNKADKVVKDMMGKSVSRLRQSQTPKRAYASPV